MSYIAATVNRDQKLCLDLYDGHSKIKSTTVSNKSTWSSKVSWSMSGDYLAIGTSSGEIFIYTEQGKLVATENYGAPILTLGWNRSGDYLAVGGDFVDDYNLRIYRLDQNRLYLSLSYYVNSPVKLRRSWSSSSFKIIQCKVVSLHWAKNLVVAVNPSDGEITPGYDQIFVFNFQNNLLELKLKSGVGIIIHVVKVSPNGKYISIGGNKSIHGNNLYILRIDADRLTSIIVDKRCLSILDIEWHLNNKYLLIGGNGGLSNLSELFVVKMIGASLKTVDEYNNQGPIKSVRWYQNDTQVVFFGVTSKSKLKYGFLNFEDEHLHPDFIGTDEGTIFNMDLRLCLGVPGHGGHSFSGNINFEDNVTFQGTVSGQLPLGPPGPPGEPGKCQCLTELPFSTALSSSQTIYDPRKIEPIRLLFNKLLITNPHFLEGFYKIPSNGIYEISVDINYNYMYTPGNRKNKLVLHLTNHNKPVMNKEETPTGNGNMAMINSCSISMRLIKRFQVGDSIGVAMTSEASFSIQLIPENSLFQGRLIYVE